MKKLFFIMALTAAVLVGASNARAADISWVSIISDDVAGADAGFTDLLRAFGHNVTRFFSHSGLTQQEIDQLNASDLVIVGRSVNSGEYDGANAVTWNTQITSPVIAMSGYIVRQNRLGWFTGSTLPDSGATRLVAADPSHPIWDNIAFDVDGVTTLTDYNILIDRGDSTPTDAPVPGGSIIASNPSLGTGVAIAEWPAGTVVTDEGGTAMTLAGDRYFFAGGSREASGNGVDTAGKYDLTDTAGLLLFFNTVDYALSPVPEPSGGIMTLLCVGLVGLARRRR